MSSAPSSRPSPVASTIPAPAESRTVLSIPGQWCGTMYRWSCRDCDTVFESTRFVPDHDRICSEHGRVCVDSADNDNAEGV